MAELSKAKKRQTANNKNKYAVQYHRTYKNKARAINRHIEELQERFDAYFRLDNTMEVRMKMRNIDLEIEKAKAALASIPLKKVG